MSRTYKGIMSNSINKIEDIFDNIEVDLKEVSRILTNIDMSEMTLENGVKLEEITCIIDDLLYELH